MSRTSKQSPESRRRRGLSKQTNARMTEAQQAAAAALVESTPVSAARQQAVERAYLREQMYGPHQAAREAVAGDDLLLDRLRVYEAAGGPPIDLSRVPRHRRPAAVEEALDTFSGGRSAKPCGACGAYSHRWPQLLDPLSQDANSRPPAHVLRDVKIQGQNKRLLLCGWCDDQRSWRSEGLVGLARAVFAATAGCRETIGSFRAWFAFERPSQITGEPWAHVNRGSAVGHARAGLVAMEVRRSRLITTEGQAAMVAAELPGVVPHVWTDVPKPGPMPMSEPTAEDRARHERERREHAALLSRKAHRSAHDRLNREQEAEVRAFIKSHPFDPEHGMTGKDALALEGLHATYRKKHHDLGCKGDCIAGGTVSSSPSRHQRTS